MNDLPRREEKSFKARIDSKMYMRVFLGLDFWSSRIKELLLGVFTCELSNDGLIMSSLTMGLSDWLSNEFIECFFA